MYFIDAIYNFNLFIITCKISVEDWFTSQYCCVMQISYTGFYLVFGVSLAILAYTKEPHLMPTYFLYFLTSLL